MPDFQNWSLHVEDRIATLTLQREAQHNTITPETLFELREVAHHIAGRDDIWAVVVSGAGAHFSVGVDVHVIGSMIGQERAAYAQTLRALQACIDTWEDLPKPTIAKIRGFCLGGGLILALACDFRIAAANAKLGFPEVKRGIAVLMGTKRITRTVGLARAKELTLLGEMILAPQAHHDGLLTKVVDNEALDSEVEDFAAKFRDLPPLTVSIAKRIADAAPDLTLRENQDMEIELQGDLLTSQDFQEGVNSFLEKRPPLFQGQ